MKKLQDNKGKKNLKNTSRVDITADSDVAGGGAWRIVFKLFHPPEWQVVKSAKQHNFGWELAWFWISLHLLNIVGLYILQEPTPLKNCEKKNKMRGRLQKSF